MLDTNMLIYLIKRKPAQVLTYFEQHDFADMCVSSITVAELEYGVAKSGSKKQADSGRLASAAASACI